MGFWERVPWPWRRKPERSGTVPEVPEHVPEHVGVASHLCLPKWVKEFDGQPVKLWDDDTRARFGTDPEHVAAVLSSFREQNRIGWVQGWVILQVYPEICWLSGLEPLTNRQLLIALSKALQKAKRRINGGNPVTCYFVPEHPEKVACVAEQAPERAAVARGNILHLPADRRGRSATSKRNSAKARKGGGRAFDGLPADAFVRRPVSAGASL